MADATKQTPSFKFQKIGGSQELEPADYNNMLDALDKGASAVARTTASVTANANITFADVTGLIQTVVPGTYLFRLVLPSTVANAAGGIKYAFHYAGGAVLSVMEASAAGFAAAASATQHTTSVADVANLFSQAAVVLLTEIRGTFTVTTGGTIQVQMAQSASDASNSVALLGGSFELQRIS